MSRGPAKRLELYARGRFLRDAAALLLALLLSIPALLWFAGNWYVTPDAAQYLLRGWNLISGQGYTSLDGVPHTRRGPVLPSLLGLLMLVFGRDVDSLAWAARVLAILNPWLTYFLIRRFSGPVAGLLAAALVALFGYTATLPQAFNLDAVLLTFYLPSILALLVAVERGGAPLVLLSGLLLGTTMITKETAFASLPPRPARRVAARLEPARALLALRGRGPGVPAVVDLGVVGQRGDLPGRGAAGVAALSVPAP